MISHYLQLEVLPKARFHKKHTEVAFMDDFLSSAAAEIGPSAKIASDAIELASRYDLSPIDALHVSSAIAAKADQLITLEGRSKPLLRVKEINVVSLQPE